MYAAAAIWRRPIARAWLGRYRAFAAISRRNHKGLAGTNDPRFGASKLTVATAPKRRSYASQSRFARSSVTRVQSGETPAIAVDEVGAISMVSQGEAVSTPIVFENVDGKRINDGRYDAFAKEISEFVPKARQFTDPLRTFAYGTDASFYRLNPKMVVKVHTEEEIRRILPIASKHGVPVTFRAAGTSLSGQALTDSVLLKISHTGRSFRNCVVHGDGSAVTVQPGLIGGEVNRILAAHKAKHRHPVQYKIGPDPASIDSCMIGGIVSNNASGMCCGVSQNTYHTLRDMRMVLVDGSVLDTADPASRSEFLESHRGLVEGVVALTKQVQADKELSALIRRKFSIKCTTGYSINALVDFPVDDPIEIIKHVMVGSEGTLAFVSQVTYNTVPEWPHKASSFVLFPDVRDACSAAAVLRRETSVNAVELMDRASLRECEKEEALLALVPDIEGAGPTAAALLIECRGATAERLEESISEVRSALKGSGLAFGSRAGDVQPLETYDFQHDAAKCKVYWDVRKGIFPIVGGARRPGTSILLEDVACPVDRLPDMAVDLIQMFQKFEYTDASLFGHALEGNLHLCFSQGFRTPAEVRRFHHMMGELVHIVAVKHGGSLKGEHGTGRNVAPYVEMEWGTKATELMWDLKDLFDPANILNPGVILNKDPLANVKHLKPSPTASQLVDRCTECGSCESNCPSRDVTLTPRERIATFKELSRLRGLEARTPEQEARLTEMLKAFEYEGKETCAADGMCQEKCPLKINMGDLTKELRSEDMAKAPTATWIAATLADNFETVARMCNKLLTVVDGVHGVLGAGPLQAVTSALNRASGHAIPDWNPYMPKGAAPVNMHPPKPQHEDKGIPRKVVYAPACVTRIMGPSRGDEQQASVHEKMLSLFAKAGYEVIYPGGLSSSCCGLMFDSRGFRGVAAKKAQELEQALLKASEGGKYPVVIDTAPCLKQLKSALTEPTLKFALYEPVEFIRLFMLDRLDFKKVRGSVAVHVPCSSKKMGFEDSFMKVASLCADSVVSSAIPCCGMAGDRGMRFPELTDASLQHLNVQGCSDGYSTSRTCEMSLSTHSGIYFRGLVYLVDEATKPKPQPQQKEQVKGQQ